MGRKHKPPAPDSAGKNGTPKPRPVRQGKVDAAGRRWWTDTERAEILAALDANGGNMSRTSRELGVPLGTIACWKLGYRWPEALQLRNEKGNKLALALEEIAWQLAAVIPEKLPDAPLNHLATTIGIVLDKIQFLLNKPLPTPNVPSSDSIDVTKLTDDERSTLIQLLDRARRSNDPAECAEENLIEKAD